MLKVPVSYLLNLKESIDIEYWEINGFCITGKKIKTTDHTLDFYIVVYSNNKDYGFSILMDKEQPPLDEDYAYNNYDNYESGNWPNFKNLPNEYKIEKDELLKLHNEHWKEAQIGNSNKNIADIDPNDSIDLIFTKLKNFFLQYDIQLTLGQKFYFMDFKNNKKRIQLMLFNINEASKSKEDLKKYLEKIDKHLKKYV